MRTDLLLSLILVVTDRGLPRLSQQVQQAAEAARSLVRDYEIVVVANGVSPDSWRQIRKLGEQIANVCAHRLIQAVRPHEAFAVGLDVGIGDILITLDPDLFPLDCLQSLLEGYDGGADVVFALRNDRVERRSGSLYEFMTKRFYRFLTWAGGIRIPEGLSPVVLFSRRAVKEVTANADRHSLFPLTGLLIGLEHQAIAFTPVSRSATAGLGSGMARASQVMVLASPGVIRSITMLALGAAALNLAYSGYVVITALIKEDVAAGWTSLSLQMSGLFFLLLLILAAFGQMLSHIIARLQARPPFVVVDEISSLALERKQSLNVLLETRPLNAEDPIPPRDPREDRSRQPEPSDA